MREGRVWNGGRSEGVTRPRWPGVVAGLLVTLALLLAGVAGAAASEMGKIEGRLVNRTADGTPVAGQTVELLAFQGGVEKEARSTVVDAEGRFAFSDLTREDTLYILRAKFEGVTYLSQQIDLAGGEPQSEIELAVFGATDSADTLAVTRNHVIVDIDPVNQVLRVLDVFVVTNKGDRTYVGANPTGGEAAPTLRLALPAGAGHVTSNAGMDPAGINVVDGAVVDTAPVRPGTHELVVSYTVPFRESAATLARALDYPVERVSVVLRDVGATVDWAGLGKSEALEIEGKRYVHLTGQNVAAGETVSVRLTDIPASLPAEPGTAGGDSMQQGVLLVVAGLTAVGAALGVAYPFLRKRRAAPVSAGGSRTEAVEEWETLVQAIADLDDDFEAGRIAEAEYGPRRAEMKARLLDLSRRTGKG